MIGTYFWRSLSLVVRVLVLPLHLALAWYKRIREKLLPPRFQVRGHCHSNGACCERLFLQEGPYLSWPVLRQLTHFWMTRIYPFEIHEHSMLHAGDETFYRMVTCRNLENGRCKEYWLRPTLCRVWPLGTEEKPPHLFRGCGFWVEDSENPEEGDVSRRKPSFRRADRGTLIASWTQAPAQTYPPEEQPSTLPKNTGLSVTEGSAAADEPLES